MDFQIVNTFQEIGRLLQVLPIPRFFKIPILTDTDTENYRYLLAIFAQFFPSLKETLIVWFSIFLVALYAKICQYFTQKIWDANVFQNWPSTSRHLYRDAISIWTQHQYIHVETGASAVIMLCNQLVTNAFQDLAHLRQSLHSVCMF